MTLHWKTVNKVNTRARHVSTNVFFSRVRSTQSSVAFNSFFLLATFKFLIIKRLVFMCALIYSHLSVHLISTVLLGVIAFVFHATSF